MGLLQHKKDKYGQTIKPGDVCVYSGRYVVFKKPSWGGPLSQGLYGQFVDMGKTVSVRYSSVLFAFDPFGDRRADSKEVKQVIKGFYE